MLLPISKEDTVDSLIKVTQTFRNPTEQQDFRNWLLDQRPKKKEDAVSQFGLSKSDKWIGFGDKFHSEP
jgi:hypothetical protein